MDRGVRWATVHGLQRVGTLLKRHSYLRPVLTLPSAAPPSGPSFFAAIIRSELGLELPGAYSYYLKTLFFSFIFISWRLITLQYCSGFCHTLT